MKNKILLYTLLFSSFILNGCSINNKDMEDLKAENSYLKTENSELRALINRSDNTDNSNSNDSEIFSINEEAFVFDNNRERLYSLKILNATTALSNTDDSYTKGLPENTVQITYEYKNYSYNKSMLISTQFINAYTDDGSAGEATNMMDGQAEVSKGKSSQSTTWFVMNKPMTDVSSIEIEYLNDFSLGFKDSIKFKVPLNH